MKTFVSILLSLLFSHLGWVHLESNNYAIAPNEIVEIIFHVSELEEYPFDVSFFGIFEHKDGTILKIPGFYKGEKAYAIRFSAYKKGVWTFTTKAKQEAQLDGNTGKVHIKGSFKKSALQEPLMVDVSNPQKIRYPNGKPYLSKIFDGGDLLKKSHQDFSKTKDRISTIKKKGFNQIMISLYDMYAVGKGTDFQTTYTEVPAFAPFKKRGLEVDFETLNLSFFNRLDEVVRYLQEQNMIAHLMLYTDREVSHRPLFYSHADNLYFDYIVKRYQAFPNVVWNIAEKSTGRGEEGRAYLTERIDRLRHYDAYKRLLTVSDHEYCKLQPKKVDVVLLETAHKSLLEEVSYQLKKPVFSLD